MNIDHRETDFIAAVKFLQTLPAFKSITFETKNLEIGDIEFPEFGILFERKTMNDLSASIKDGRYSEQGHRLSSSPIHNHNIYYLIEGDFARRSDKQMLCSAFVSLQHFKGFSMIRVPNINESAYFLCNMLLKLQKEKKPGFYEVAPTNLTEEETDKQYTSFVKKQKKANITRNNINEIMLMQIPGISNIIAGHIMKEFETIHNLATIVQTDVERIKTFTYEKKKLAKNVVEALITFLG